MITGHVCEKKNQNSLKTHFCKITFEYVIVEVQYIVIWDISH